jgi:hypothetical protein
MSIWGCYWRGVSLTDGKITWTGCRLRFNVHMAFGAVQTKRAEWALYDQVAVPLRLRDASRE